MNTTTHGFLGQIGRAAQQHFARTALAATLLLGAIGVTQNAWAEGSRSMFPSGIAGARAPMDLTNNALYAGVANNRQFIYVYVQANEYILAGSSNRNNGGDVFIYNPQSFGARGNETIPGTADYTCSTSNSPPASYGGAGRGVVTTRVAELAGPNSADNSVTVTNGWSPCAYRAPTTGIYGVRFSGATSGTSALTGTLASANPQILAAQVAAWEVAVRATATSTTDLNGRVFTFAWIGRTGSNGVNGRLRHPLYYVTEDGYRYRQTANDLDPFAYALFGNRAGFLDTGNPLYKTTRGTNQTVSTYAPAGTGISAQAPQYPMFFSDVSDTGPNDAEVERVLTALGIPHIPPVPQLNSVSFTGTIGGATTAFGGGGIFSFTTVNTLSFQIVISRDGVDFDPANVLNRVLSGTALTGTHSVFWDGRDNAGNFFPLGTGYPFRIDGRNGEVHFPIIDTEGMAFGGPTVQKLNGSQDATIYYDDRGYRTRNGTLVGVLNGHICGAGSVQVQPTATHSLVGVDSSDGNLNGPGLFYRRYPQVSTDSNADCTNLATEHFGTAKGLDSWALERTPIISQTLDIVPPIVGADPGTIVTVQPSAFPGQSVFGTLVFYNNGDTAAAGTTYTAVIGTPGSCPAAVNFTLLPAGVAVGSYNTTTCAVTFTGMPASLPASSVGGQLVFNFNYVAPGVGTQTVNTTIAATNEVIGAVAPNSASGSTVIVLADVAATVSVPAFAAPGSQVAGTLQFSNLGSASATAFGLTYAATIGTAGSCPAGVDFPSIAPVTFVYNATTCQVTFTGLPSNMAPGALSSLGFVYTAPLSGTIPVTAQISTITPESSAANNSANGSTTIVIADMSATLGAIAAVVSPGQVLTGLTLVCANGGPNQALNATCVPTADVGTVSNIVCVPPQPQASLANGASISCTYDYAAPGTPGGSNTGPTTVNFTGTTGATNDSNAANNVSNDSATIIDALSDATSLPGGSTGQTFNVAGNDEFPPGSTFTIQPGSTCANPGVSLAGVATFDVTPSPCTVNYRVCAPAPNGTVCDTAVLTVTGTTTDMQAVLGPIPSVVSPGQTLTGLTLTCTNIGSNPAVNASCVPAADVGTVSNLVCVPVAPVTSLSNVAPNNAIVCSYDYLAPGTPGGSNTVATTVNFTGTTGATNDSNAANNVSNDSATIIDALSDATSLPGGSTGQTFNVAGNDEFPPGSTFTIQPGSTCANPGVSLAGVATFDVTPSPCTVNYQVCAPAPNTTVCDTAVLTVTGTTTDMQAVLGPIPSVVSPGQSLTGLTLTCTNIGSNPAVNASCVPAADVGTISNLVCVPAAPVTSLSNVAPNNAIVCSYDYLAPGTPGGSNTGPTAANFTGTTGAANDSNAANNVSNDSATIIDALSDATSLPGGSTGQTFNLAGNDEFPPGSTFTIQPGSTCANPGVSGAGVATFDVTPSPCTVNYRVCAPAPNGTVCDTAVLTVTGTTTDMQAVLGPIPSVVSPGQSLTGLTLTCTNIGSNPAVNASCVPAADVGTVSNLVCVPVAPVASLSNVAPNNAIVCSYDYLAPGTPGGSNTGPTTVNFTGTTGASNDSNAANNVDNDSATIIDALNDATSLPSGSTGQTFNLSTNDEFPGGSSFSYTGGTCANASVAGATGIATFDVVPSPCTVTYQVCAPAPNGTVCDTATLNVTGTGTDMQATLGPIPSVVSPGQSLPGLTLTCTNIGANPAINATCVPTADVGTVSNLVCVPVAPVASLSNVAPNNAIVCSYDYLAPGTPGGSNTGPTTVNFTGTTGAGNDNNPANNVDNDSATIIDALNDATSLPGGSTGQTFNLAGNDEFPPGSTFSILPGSTCANPGVSGVGVATFDVTPSPCTVNYQVCAPAPNTTVCDTAVLTVTGTTTDMQAVLGPIPSVVSPGQSLPGLTLTCTNIGSNPAINATCVPAADVGTVSNLVCVPVAPVASLSNVAPNNAIVCSYDYLAPGTPGGSNTGPTTVNFTGTTGASNDSNVANNVDSDSATIIDALNDTTTLPGGLTGQTFNLAGNDEFPPGSTFTIQPGSTCANPSVSLAGVATFDVTPSPCTVNYQVCAPAPNGTVCDTAVLTVTGTTTDMEATLGAIPADVSPGQSLTGLTLTCTNIGSNPAINASCVPTADVGTISNLVCVPVAPVASLSNVAPNNAIVCSYDYLAPGTPGGTNTGPTTVNFTGTTGATNDTAPANNVDTDVATIIDAINDATTLPGGATGQTFNLSTNDEFPVGSTFTYTGGTCANGSVAAATGIATFDVVPAPCTVTYQVCAPAPNTTVCDNATLVVTGSVTDMAATLGPIPADVSPGQTLVGLTLTCENIGANAATNATCAPGADVGAISNLVCVPLPPRPILLSGASIICTFDYTAPGIAGGSNTGPTTVNFTGTTSATNDSVPANNVDTDVATIIDAVNDATTLPGGATGQTFPLAGNDEFPPGSTFTYTGGTCANASVANATGIATFDVNPTPTCTVTYQVCAPAPNTTVCDNATLTVTGAPPQIVVTKVANPATGTTVVFGQTITYTVTSVITGGVLTAPFTLTDTLGTGLTFGSVSAAGAYTCNAANPLVCSLPTGTAQGSYPLVYTATVNASASGSVGNSVVPVGGGDPDPVCSPCTTSNPVTPQILVTKSSNPVSGSAVLAGDTITYTVSLNVSNGPTTAPVVLTDTLDADLSFGSVSNNPGGFTLGGAGNVRTFTLASGAASGIYVVVYTATVNANATGSVGNSVVPTGGGDPDPTCTTCTTSNPVTPQIAVNKVSNPASGTTVLAGDTITYTLSLAVTNGPTTAPTVLTDTLDADLTFGSVTSNTGGFTAGGAGSVRTFTLASGAATGTYVVQYTATVNANATGSVGNSVVAAGGGDPDPACTPCATTHPVVPQIAVTKSSNPASGTTILAGDTITYTLSLAVTNGPTTAPTVLTDTLDADLTFGSVTSNTGGFTAGGAGNVRTFTLASGAATGTYLVQYTATVNANATGSVGNSVVAAGGGDPDPACTPCATTHPVVPQIAVTKSSNPASGTTVLAGDTITYTVSLAVTNGPTTAPTVLTDTLDADLTFGSVTSNAGGFTAGGAGNVRTFTLPSGAATGTYVVQYTATVNANATGSVGNSVVAAGGGDPDPACTPCATTHPVVPQIAVTKSSNPASGTTVLAGATITYTLTLNVANGPTTAPTVLTDTLDSDLTFVAVTSNTGGFTAGGAGSVRTFTLASGAATGTYVVQYTATVNANATGTVGNSVVAAGGGDPDPVCTPCTTGHPVIPQIAVSKSSNPASGTTVLAGDTITYTVSLAVTNGPTTAPTVLTDTLDADLTFGSVTSNTGGFTAGGAGSVRTFTMPTGAATGTYVVQYTATVNANATGTVGNSVVAAGGGDPDPVCTPCTTGHPVIPQISATKSSNPASGTTVLAGATITYTLTLNVANGPTTAPTVLTDTLDADLSFGSVTSNTGGFTVGGAGNVRTFTLPTGAATGTYVVQYTATVNANATGTVGNSVVAAGGGDPDPVCTPCTTVNPVIPQIAVSKSSNPASGTTVLAGDTITYTVSLAVTNGPTTAPTVLTDTLDADLTFVAVTSNTGGFTAGGAGSVRTFTLPTGAVTGTYVVQYTATVNGNATGTVGNSVVAAGGGDPDPVCTPCTTAHPVIPQIAVSKASNPASGTTVLAGATITYTVAVNVTNGPTTAPTVLTDTLDSDLTFGSVTSNTGGFTAGGAGNVRTFTLPTGAVTGVYLVEYTATVNADATGSVGNSVVAAGGGDPDPVCTPCTTTHPVIPQIAVSKSSNPASGTLVLAGDTITYTVSLAVTNGPTTAPTVLTDTLDADLTFVAVTSNTGGFTAGGASSVRTFTLPAGAVTGTYVVQYTATVNANATGTVGNSVVATGGGDPDPVCTPCTTGHPVIPQIAVSKSSNPATGSTVAAGNTITYTVSLVVTNGPTTAPSVLTDTLDSDLSFGSVTSNTGGFTLGGAGNVRTFTLPTGAVSGTYVVQYTATVNANATGTVGNSVVATGGGDPNPVCTPCTTIHPLGPPILAVAKTLTGESITVDGIAQPGENLTYTIVVTNTGGSIANNTIVNEIVPANTVFVGGAPTWTCAVGAPAGTACNATVTVPAPSGGNPGTVSATFTVRVSDPIPAGVLTIANAVAINDLPPPNCTVSPTPPACVVTPTMSLRLSKAVQSVTATGPNAFNVSYLITVSNVGGAAGVYTLIDTLNYPAVGVSFNGNGRVTTSGGTVNPLLAGGLFAPVNGFPEQFSATSVALPSGASHSYTVVIPIAVAAGGVANGTCNGSPGNGLFNGAAITGSQALGTNACAPIDNASVIIRLVKTVRLGVDVNGNNYGDVGDVLHYDFVISNPGVTPLNNVRLLDPRVTDLACSPLTTFDNRLRVLFADDIFVNPFEPEQTVALIPGDSIVCAATHTLTAADVAARRVDNTATAAGTGPQNQVATSISTAIFSLFQ